MERESEDGKGRWGIGCGHQRSETGNDMVGWHYIQIVLVPIWKMNLKGKENVPGGTLVMTLSFHYWGQEFKPWL